MMLRKVLKALKIKKIRSTMQKIEENMYTSIDSSSKKFSAIFPYFAFKFIPLGYRICNISQKNQLLSSNLSGKFDCLINCYIDGDRIRCSSVILNIDPTETSFAVNDPDRENKFMNIIKKYHDAYKDKINEKSND